jgi:hypothetical protein
MPTAASNICGCFNLEQILWNRSKNPPSTISTSLPSRVEVDVEFDVELEDLKGEDLGWWPSGFVEAEPEISSRI